MPRIRINRDNFDRIKGGMTLAEVKKILGEPEPALFAPPHVTIWQAGPNWIHVAFNPVGFLEDQVGEGEGDKEIHLATPLVTLEWYAKKGADKIGIKW